MRCCSHPAHRGLKSLKRCFIFPHPAHGFFVSVPFRRVFRFFFVAFFFVLLMGPSFPLTTGHRPRSSNGSAFTQRTDYRVDPFCPNTFSGPSVDRCFVVTCQTDRASESAKLIITSTLYGGCSSFIKLASAPCGACTYVERAPESLMNGASPP